MDNKLTISDQNSIMAHFEKTDDILHDMRGIIDSARDAAYQSVNIALVQRNWLIGYRIAEEELNGERRAEYETEIVKRLSKKIN